MSSDQIQSKINNSTSFTIEIDSEKSTEKNLSLQDAFKSYREQKLVSVFIKRLVF
jgi:hypothetical protein